MAKKVAAKEAVPLTEDGAVIYTDSGMRQNSTGIGIHGYTFSYTPAKQGTGLKGAYALDTGYSIKDDGTSKNITVLKYIDGLAGMGTITNNEGELTAVTEALKIVSLKHPDVKKITILSDSQYAVRGITEFLPRWVVNGYKKSDGTEVKNIPSWQNVYNTMQALQNKQNPPEITIKWVKGHNGDVGNEKADKLATVALLSTKGTATLTELTTTPAKGYWTVNVNRPVFITEKSLFVNSCANLHRRGVYFLTGHKNDEALLDRGIDNGKFAIVELDTPDPILELVIEAQQRNAVIFGGLNLIRLDMVYSKKIYPDIEKYGDKVLYPKQRDSSSLYYIGEGVVTSDSDDGTDRATAKDPVTLEVKPPLKGMRITSAWAAMSELLTRVKEYKLRNPKTTVSPDEERFLINDITEQIQKTITSYVDQPVESIFIEGIEQRVELVINLDLPNINHLRAINKCRSVKYELLRWAEGEFLRYAVFISTPDARGIWCGWYSNRTQIKV